MKKIVLFAVLVVLSACATSPQGLERPEYATTFQLDQGYQLSLKNIVDGDEECRRGPLLPVGQVINDVHHYPDLREAKIVQGASGFGRQIYRVISVRGVDAGTEVTVYAKHHGAKIAEQYALWARGNRDCIL
ncbi:hypothetical protein [Halopseudomonas formosensis]|uniref:Lipoprotein n=1 Tax=Halopseudomonas formosensis TaxID=1002526 RepID=A0ABU5C2D6_9GAMM|nr:hypothetical protein [Halopseudomonas formosensis]MDX9688803.1 hypothetical protein [Halopseudomonas formosensis]